jgi:hypothetical protein
MVVGVAVEHVSCAISCCCCCIVDSTVTSQRGESADSSLLTDAGVADEDGGRFGLKGVDEGNGVIALIMLLVSLTDVKVDLITPLDFGRFGSTFEK